MEKIFLYAFYKEDVRDIRERDIREPRNYTTHNDFSSLQRETELEGWRLEEFSIHRETRMKYSWNCTSSPLSL